jgi:hypothetical protein
MDKILRLSREMPIPIGMEHCTLVMDHLRQYPPQISELTFGGLFTWRKSHPIFLLELDGTLLFITGPSPESPDCMVMGELVGPPIPTSAIRTFIPGLRGYTCVPEPAVARLRDEGLQITPDDNNSDYVYRVEDLGDLKDEKYRNKRNLVRQCLDDFDCSYEIITPALIPECLAMQALWCRQHRCERKGDVC